MGFPENRMHGVPLACLQSRWLRQSSQENCDPQPVRRLALGKRTDLTASPSGTEKMLPMTLRVSGKWLVRLFYKPFDATNFRRK
jgi:hypothetical protein